jgi:hypothetical protein
MKCARVVLVSGTRGRAALNADMLRTSVETLFSLAPVFAGPWRLSPSVNPLRLRGRLIIDYQFITIFKDDRSIT